MPRKPKFIHPIRALRQIISEAEGHTVSQPAFAKMVGTSPATIQSVELGRLKLSQQLARKIAAPFCIAYTDLMNNKGRPRNLVTGEPFNAEFYKSLQRSTATPSSYRFAYDSIQHTLKEVEALLIAANSPTKNRRHVLAIAFNDWLKDTAMAMGLVEEWGRIRKCLPEERKALLKKASSVKLLFKV